MQKILKWKCLRCGCVVESAEKPSSRYEPVITLPVYGEKSFEGIPNTNTQSPASHYGPVCFGNERGEDYYEHNWREKRK